MEYFDVSFLMAYNSMFHSARALLFSQGLKERSHACLILFLKEEFSENKKILDSLTILDSYRLTRHAIQYTGGLCSETDAEEAVNDAKKFLKAVEEIVRPQ